MEHAYWVRRHREELALAQSTTCIEARLIHLDLAGRYRAKAGEMALALDPPLSPLPAETLTPILQSA